MPVALENSLRQRLCRTCGGVVEYRRPAPLRNPNVRNLEHWKRKIKPRHPPMDARQRDLIRWQKRVAALNSAAGGLVYRADGSLQYGTDACPLRTSDGTPSRACCCSSSSGTCFNPSGSSGCGANCVDASLPSSVVVDLTPLTVCLTGCQALPTSITADSTGTCADAFAPRFLGYDSPLHQNVVSIEWDPDNTCFILYVEGATGAPYYCQLIMWVGYGGAGNPTGTYTRACGGGCDANSSVLTLTVS